MMRDGFNTAYNAVTWENLQEIQDSISSAWRRDPNTADDGRPDIGDTFAPHVDLVPGWIREWLERTDITVPTPRVDLPEPNTPANALAALTALAAAPAAAPAQAQAQAAAPATQVV
jgi:hypothetical protein